MVDLSRTDDAAAREDELNQALELFYFGYREFTAYPDQVLDARGLARMHHRILYFVGRNPGISVNGLLGILGVSKQALHAPLKKLAEEGLVQSKPAENDRRARELRLTRQGAKLERQLSDSQRELMGTVFETVGHDGEEAWRRVMRLIAKAE